MTFVLDEAGRIMHINRVGEDATGYRLAEIQGRCYWDVFFPSDYAPEVKTTVLQLIAERFTGNYEHFLVTRDGKRRWFAWAITILPGETPCLAATGVDISERRQAEEHLRVAVEKEWGDSSEKACCTVVRALAQNRRENIVLAGRLIGTEPDRVRTFAVFFRGQRLENFDFPLNQTLGENFIRQTDAVYRPCPSWRFPTSAGEHLEITNFAGCSILDIHGNSIGLLAVLSSGPLPSPGAVKSLLQVYSGRAAGEMERQHAEERLRLLSLAIEHSPTSVVITDAHSRIQYVNKRFVELTGYDQEEVYGKNPGILKSGQTPQETYQTLWRQLRAGKEWRGHFLNRKKNGDLFWEEASISPLLNEQGAITHFVAVKEDITERKQLEARIWHQANYDSLTDLPNRLLFIDRLQQALRQSARDTTKTALLFIDLDRFKAVNDTLGHEVGDDMLREMARRIRACVRTDDTVARMGGDEFTVILPKIKDAEGADKVSGKILASLGEPFLLSGRKLLMTASIGIAIYPDNGQNYTSLLKHADTAMYKVKEKGRNASRVHSLPSAADQPANGN